MPLAVGGTLPPPPHPPPPLASARLHEDSSGPRLGGPPPRPRAPRRPPLSFLFLSRADRRTFPQYRLSLWCRPAPWRPSTSTRRSGASTCSPTLAGGLNKLSIICSGNQSHIRRPRGHAAEGGGQGCGRQAAAPRKWEGVRCLEANPCRRWTARLDSVHRQACRLAPPAAPPTLPSTPPCLTPTTASWAWTCPPVRCLLRRGAAARLPHFQSVAHLQVFNVVLRCAAAVSCRPRRLPQPLVAFLFVFR